MPCFQIQIWLTYWNNSGLVAVDRILALEQVAQARKYCQCMRVGIFADISDLAIWRALCDLRGIAP